MLHEWHLPGGVARDRLRYLFLVLASLEPLAWATVDARLDLMISMSCSAIFCGSWADETSAASLASEEPSGASWVISSQGRLGGRRPSEGVFSVLRDLGADGKEEFRISLRSWTT